MDLLLGVTHCKHCTWDEVNSSLDRNLTAWKTIFDWTIGGAVSGSSGVSICLKTTSMDTRADELLQKFWAMEEVPGEMCNGQEE